MLRNLEYKSLNVVIKSFDAIKGIFKGYAASFNQVDKVNDTMLPQSFDNSIEAFNNGTKIPVNYDHFEEIELADNFLTMTKDDYGLLVEFQISEDAKVTYSELYAKFVVLAQTGKLFMSIGGYVIKSKLGEDRWIKKMVANANDDIEEFELDHVAVTEYPIDSNAKMLEVKSKRGKKTSKSLSDIDGLVSAVKYLKVNKSTMSNVAVENFISHLKSMWDKELDIKSEVNKKELESQGNEVQGEVIVSGDRSKKEATILKSVAKYLI
jgi:HK97 family phage prohead protease